MKTIDKEEFLEFLKTHARGRERCYKSVVLRDLFGGSGADLRRVVNELRQDGEPVGSNRNGYFYCIRYSEINDTVQHLHHRADGILKAAEGLLRAGRSIESTPVSVSVPTQN